MKAGTEQRHGSVRALLLALAVLVLGLIALGWWQAQQNRPKPAPARAMSAGVVISQEPVGEGRLKLHVRFDADGTHTVTGEVDRAAFERDGGTVWVCHSPSNPADTKKQWIRLPTDRLCSQR